MQNKLRGKRKASVQKKRVFEMVKASDLEKGFAMRKKREQTLMDINLTFVDELMYIKNDNQEEAAYVRRQQKYVEKVITKC